MTWFRTILHSTKLRANMRSTPHMFSTLKRSLSLRVVLLTVAAAVASNAAEPLSPEERKLNLESFDIVWTTIKNKHFDPTLGGLDWDKIRGELRPKVEAAANIAEVRSALSDMLKRLKQSHFGIIPRDAYRSLEADKLETGEGESGISVRVVGNSALVWTVEPGSPAAKAGVKPGWIISKIRGREIPPIIERVAKARSNDKLLTLYQSRSIEAGLDGDVGKTIKVVFLDEHDQPIEKEVGFMKPLGQPARFGNLPTMHVRCESRRIDGPAGPITYIKLNTFFDPPRVMGKIQEALTAQPPAKAVILDLRGNPGGIAGMAMGIGGWFVERPDQKLGTLSTRESSLRFTLNPRPSPFLGPLAVLVDEFSMSTSEILSGGLKDIGRARIFGTQTPGAALPSVISRLPNGDGFQYAFADYVSASGIRLEGRGVEPHEVIPIDRKALLEGNDLVLDAALNWIKNLPTSSTKVSSL